MDYSLSSILSRFDFIDSLLIKINQKNSNIEAKLRNFLRIIRPKEHIFLWICKNTQFEHIKLPYLYFKAKSKTSYWSLKMSPLKIHIKIPHFFLVLPTIFLHRSKTFGLLQKHVGFILKFSRIYIINMYIYLKIAQRKK